MAPAPPSVVPFDYPTGVTGRRNAAPDSPPAQPEQQPARTDAGKGRPTPRRKEAEARNKRPLVPADRKAARRAAKQRDRQRRQEAWARQQKAMETGDERYLPPRDKGPVRRYARDYVDARWSIAELFLPIAVVLLVAMFFTTVLPQIALYATVAMYGLLLLALADSLIMVQLLKRRLRARFDADRIPRWTGLYALSRSFQMRRLRMPKPQVARGQYPA